MCHTKTLLSLFLCLLTLAGQGVAFHPVPTPTFTSKLCTSKADLSEGPFRTVLAIEDKWILEELLDSSTLPSPRQNSERSIWLVQGPGPVQELSVYHNDLPRNVQKQPSGIFRLSQLTANRKDDATTGKDNSIQVHTNESLEIGTKLLWEDSWLKIWEFRILPNENCDFHRHLHPYFFLNLSESLTQELDRQLHPVDRPPNLQTQGQCTYVSRENLSAHGVKNVGEDTFLQFIVEFL